ncbi:MAG: pantetheine-phosphate adenylyltransferase [Clostridia bacterium]|nr:pantetheine-phosphate adenylyltransferase [Clostridia bacterium]
MKYRAAMIPGSFDPVTLGHVDVIERAAAMFDTVYVTAFKNAEKHGMFTDEEKLEMLKLATAHLDNVVCSMESILVAEFAHVNHAVIVKGIRGVSDFDYETSLFHINRAIYADTDTIFIPAKQEVQHISSSFAREMIRYGHPLDNCLPKPVIAYVEAWKKRQ